MQHRDYGDILLQLLRLPWFAQMVKNLPAIQETQVPSLAGEDPPEEGVETHPSTLPGESLGQRGLVGYSPRGHKVSDTAEQLIHTHIITISANAV